MILPVYFSYREIISLPGDIWRTPRLTSTGMDYESYWGARGGGSIQPRYQVIAGIVAEGSTVLEIGCGDGLFLEYLERTRKVMSKGYDVSEFSVSLAKKRGLDVEVADVISHEFRVESTHDYVLACEVLEHLSNPEILICKLRGCYKRALIVSVPNIGYFKHRLRLLFGRFPLQWVMHPSEHLRYWSILDFCRWAREMELQVIKVLPANGLSLLNLHRMWPNLLANDVVYVLEDETAAGNHTET